MNPTEIPAGQFEATSISGLTTVEKPVLDSLGETCQPAFATEPERSTTLKRVAITYPSGNTTAIVFDQLLDSDRRALNAQIMQAWRDTSPGLPEVEQCCFVTLPQDRTATARVEMFGGEFCGNATRSVAWLVAKGQNSEGRLEVSGVERALAFRVQDSAVSLEMPLPDSCQLVRSVSEGSLVQLAGITQLVVTQPKGEQTPRQLLARLLEDNQYNLRIQPAVGVSYYDHTSGKASFCVWVKEVDTIFDETACGSGTCAIGIALAASSKQSVCLDVTQPSGENIITETTCQGGAIVASSITGEVTVLYDGELGIA